MHILASGPVLQAVRFGYVILGERDWLLGERSQTDESEGLGLVLCDE
jgi:hypothetical protein